MTFRTFVSFLVIFFERYCNVTPIYYLYSCVYKNQLYLVIVFLQ